MNNINRLILLDSEHKLQILQQLRTTLTSLTALLYNMVSATLTIESNGK